MKNNLRYKCKGCSWVGYRGSIKPCPKCSCDVESFPSTRDIIPFSEDMKKFIHQNYKKMLYPDIAKTIGTSESRVCNYINRTGLRLSSIECERRKRSREFKPGQISWNKGITYKPKANIGQFSKGHLPHNTKIDGTIVWRCNQKKKNNVYYWIRIALGKWKMLHVYLWEQTYGPIPKGFIVRFKDGDHRNCKVENVEMVTRAEHLDRNRPTIRKNSTEYDRYIAALLKIRGKKKQDLFIKNHPEIIEAKRQQLKLERVLNEVKRQVI